MKSQCNIYDTEGRKWDLLEFLEKHCEDQLDVSVYLGAKRVSCRLLACVVSEEVVQARRRKLKEYASKKLLELARWTVVCTSVPCNLKCTRACAALTS